MSRRSQGRPLSDRETRRIATLLRDTELSMSQIAERMDCARATVTKINKTLAVRFYGGRRNDWQLPTA